jgi:hypothetical protein
VSSPLVYHFKDGSNQWWTAVQLRNVRNAVSTLEFEKDGAFVAAERRRYNYFVREGGMGKGPLTFRVTDVHGSSLTDTASNRATMSIDRATSSFRHVSEPIRPWAGASGFQRTIRARTALHWAQEDTAAAQATPLQGAHGAETVAGAH